MRECGLKYSHAHMHPLLDESLPLRECGLKYTEGTCRRNRHKRHSPCGSVDWNTGAYYNGSYSHGHSPCGSVDWNTILLTTLLSTVVVTPLAGVWIEILMVSWLLSMVFCHSPCGSVDWNGHWRRIPVSGMRSLPLRECGLKWRDSGTENYLQNVTPLAGVWIEIIRRLIYKHGCYGHSPCGSVDWNGMPAASKLYT